MKAYEGFWASLDLTEWLLIIGLVAALILVAVAAAALGNPTRGQPPPADDQLPYLGAHRKADPQELTTNLSKYRRIRRD